MLKDILKLGSTLSKEEQKEIKGGFLESTYCRINSDCYFTVGGFPFGHGDVFCGSNGFCQYY